MDKLRIIVNYLSLYWLLIIIGAFLYALFKTGVMPHFSNPDPNYIIPYYDSIFKVYNLTGWLMLFAIILNSIKTLKGIISKSRIIDVSMIVFLMSFTLLLIQIFIDPFGLNAWFFD